MEDSLLTEVVPNKPNVAPELWGYVSRPTSRDEVGRNEYCMQPRKRDDTIYKVNHMTEAQIET